LKKLSNTWNIRFLYVVGALIAYALFRYIRKKKSENPQSDPKQGFFNFLFQDWKPKNDLSTQEIYNWLRKKEGVRYKAVPDGKTRDGKQLYSIGMGHQIQPNEQYLMTATITEAEVLYLFEKDIKNILADIEKDVKVPLNKNQKLAVISIRYNVGGAGLRSTQFLRKLNEGDYQGAANLIPSTIITSEGKINQGLINRRITEKELFLTKP